MVGAKIILHAKSPTFRAAKLKGFTVTGNLINSGNTNLLYMILKPKFLEPEVEVGIRN